MKTGDIVGVCALCGEDIVKPEGLSTGYGRVPDPPGEYYNGYDLNPSNKVCFSCCAKTDSEYMKTHDKVTMYLSKHEGEWHVQNWPGSLRFRASVSVSEHGHYSPLSGYMERRDAHFQDEHGNVWWAKSIGNWTEIAHCKKLKSKRAIERALWWLHPYGKGLPKGAKED